MDSAEDKEEASLRRGAAVGFQGRLSRRLDPASSWTQSTMSDAPREEGVPEELDLLDQSPSLDHFGMLEHRMKRLQRLRLFLSSVFLHDAKLSLTIRFAALSRSTVGWSGAGAICMGSVTSASSSLVSTRLSVDRPASKLA